MARRFDHEPGPSLAPGRRRQSQMRRGRPTAASGAREVAVIDSTIRYNPSDFEDYLIDLTLVKGTAAAVPLPADLPAVILEDLPVYGKTRDHLLTGNVADRSEAIFAVECQLIELGFGDAEIAAAILRSP